jgi:glycosyltransferase involved in cell wall biosynthesis
MQSVTILTSAITGGVNVEPLYERVRQIMADVGRYNYEHLFIDNASTDSTVAVLRRLAAADPNVKFIRPRRNMLHASTSLADLLRRSRLRGSSASHAAWTDALPGGV